MPGNYTVVFSQNVTSCAALGTISNNVGQINTVAGADGPNAVYVGTNGSSGAANPEPFYLAVFC
ncbi:MAG: hypothetical protein NVSMB25_20790 [Thermoleophilaceae bacterium]